MKTLNDWLQWQETLHPFSIELGLERVKAVAQRLDLLSVNFPLILVAGTNGKGSSVAMLDAILRAAGYRVGQFTSPHLLRYNERIQIQGEMIDDDSLCQAFTAIDQMRGEISLTYFEFSALAAMWCFQRANLDVAVLEIGLGGRLDAVNSFTPSVSLITNIGLDHMDWLGETREKIGTEKAGILRSKTPAVCNDREMPQSIMHYSQQIGADLQIIGHDFDYRVEQECWWWTFQEQTLQLPLPRLAGDFQIHNAAGVLTALQLLPLQVSTSAIKQGLQQVQIDGRLQVLQQPFRIILDVAHNREGVDVLSDFLKQQPCDGKTYALIGIFKDKPIAEMLAALKDCVDIWHVIDLPSSRAATAMDLQQQLLDCSVDEVMTHSNIADAYQIIQSKINVDTDRLVGLGSFLTVGGLMKVLSGSFTI